VPALFTSTSTAARARAYMSAFKQDHSQPLRHGEEGPGGRGGRSAHLLEDSTELYCTVQYSAPTSLMSGDAEGVLQGWGRGVNRELTPPSSCTVKLMRSWHCWSWVTSVRLTSATGAPSARHSWGHLVQPLLAPRRREDQGGPAPRVLQGHAPGERHGEEARGRRKCHRACNKALLNAPRTAAGRIGIHCLLFVRPATAGRGMGAGSTDPPNS